MVLRMSIKVLEQLSEIEEKIQALEQMAQENNISVDTEKLLSEIIDKYNLKRN